MAGLTDAIVKVKATQSKTRKIGLDELRRALDQARTGTGKAKINDEGYLKILVDIFEAIREEKSNPSKRGKVSDDRLQVLVEALRMIVEHGVKAFRRKRSAPALVSHISETLTTSDGEMYTPLARPYGRILRTFLEYRPHTDHLSEEEWRELVSLCVLGLNTRLSSDDSDEAHDTDNSATQQTGRRRPMISSNTPNTINMSFRSVGKGKVKTHNVSENQTIEDFCTCLAHLLSATHQPILSLATPVLDAIFQFLDTVTQTTHHQTQEPAFTILNHLLRLSSLEAIDIATRIVTQGLPVLRDLWHFKAHNGLKDQMLIFLLRGSPFFPKLYHTHESLPTELQQLSDTLYAEYSRRRDSDILHLDDLILRFADGDISTFPMTSNAYQLRTGFSRSEQAWVMLSCMADIAILRTNQTSNNLAETTDHGHHVSKRRKIEHSILDVIQMVKSASRSDKVSALQLIAFIAGKLTLTISHCETLMEVLVPCIVGEDAYTATWALLVATSISCRADSKDSTATGSTMWTQLWMLGTRALATSTQCRAAAHLLNSLLRRELVAFHDALDSIDMILTSIDLNGPTTLHDSICYFWCTVLQSKAQFTPSSAFDASQRVCQWLFKHWDPASLVQRSKFKKTQSFETADLVVLLHGVLGKFHPKSDVLKNMEYGILAATESTLIAEKPLRAYLLLEESSINGHNLDDVVITNSNNTIHSESRLKLLVRDILGYLDAQLESLTHSGALVNPVSNVKTSGDLVRVSNALCMVTFSLTHNALLPPNASSQDCRQKAKVLAQSISKYIQQSRNCEAGIDGLFAALGDSISVSHSDAASFGAHEIARCYDADFWSSVTSKEDDLAVEDLMAIDESFDSQMSRPKSDTQDTTRSRQLDTIPSNSLVYRSCQRLRAMVAFYKTGDNSSSQIIHDNFFDILTEVKGEDLLRCRAVFREILSSKSSYSGKAIQVLLQHIGGDLLSKDEFERSEAAHCMTLEILNGTVRKWISPDSEASDTAEQLYEWFVKVAVPRRILSPTAQIELAILLQKIMELRSDYGTNLTLEEPLRIFLRVFEEGSSAVKFSVGQKLATLFKLAVLKEHDGILDGIFSSLPIEPDCIEATAVRLRVMVWLGASWPTLLRRCLYAIVEAPSLVPGSTIYAECCFGELTKRLDLPQAKDLYGLFALQIIYTWLDTRDVLSLPFKLFGYKTRQEFLFDNAGEIAAQMIMRGQEKDLDMLSSESGIAMQDLLRICFCRAAAYCVARDASIRPEVNPKASNGIIRLKKLLGRDHFLTLVRVSFAEIMATLFKITDREESFNRGLERRENSSTAIDVYGEILSSGASQAPIDVSQQPSFKSANLMAEIEFLGSIIEIPAASLWSPAMYTYVFRQILTMVHPALGALNTCTVIRRLRILISIVGDTALEAYPLEMALHAFRGFITDSQCAEDVIGICRYLLSHATTYLRSEPSFLIGFAVSTMVSLRAFMDTPKDSTTQESDYISTMTRAKEFRTWLHTMLSNYTSPLLSATDLTNLKIILDAAAQTHGAGSSKLDTAEGELLLGTILGGSQNKYSLMNDNARESILEVLCSQFDFSPNYRSDILGNDKSSAEAAPLLLQTLSTRARDEKFQFWTSRVLGRAYAGNGPTVLKSLKRVFVTPVQVENASSLSHPANGSRKFVLQYLVRLLSSNTLKHVKAAEDALHAICSVKRESGDPILDCLEELPSSLLSSFTWSTWQPNTVKLASNNVSAHSKLEDQLEADELLDYSTWLRKLCISLIGCCSTDSLMPQLVNILENVPEAAQKLFAPILHMSLVLGSGKRDVKGHVSGAFRQWMDQHETTPKPCLKQALDALLYLRGQRHPQENTKADRADWLAVDYRKAAVTAVYCEMYTTALLFLETSLCKEAQTTSRRATSSKINIPLDLLLKIYQNVDDKDSFYGIRQPSTIASMLHQLEFENAGYKSLSFRGADYNGRFKQGITSHQDTEAQTIKLLDDVQLNGIALSMIANSGAQTAEIQETMFTAARKLEKWDITTPSNVQTQSAIVFKAFQDIHDKTDVQSACQCLNTAYASTMGSLLQVGDRGTRLQSELETLAILSEMEDVITSCDSIQAQDAYQRLYDRESWLITSRYDNVRTIDSCRQTLFSVINSSKEMKSYMKLRDKDARILHVRSLLDSSKLTRHHKDLQSSLNIATQLTQKLDSALELGVKVDVAVALEASHVLWDQGEISPSIRMLQDLLSSALFQQQDIIIGKPQILAILGNRISKARLEKPDEVIENYLKPAIKELKNVTTGSEAGQVFHEFAAFCDMQLQDSDNLEDLKRMEILRERKRTEVDELKAMMKTYSSQAKEADTIKNMRTKAQRWYELDDREYQRLRDGRETLMSQSLENYLLCLRACDDYDNDALRFSALWLEHYERDIANAAVKAHIQQVPSRKFASLMNQWTSRQQDVDTEFQKQLFNLILRICNDHPFHGMYHIFTSSKSKGGKDPTALSRNAAATKVANKLKEQRRSGSTWIAIHNTNVNFVRFATDKPQGGKAKEGTKLLLTDLTHGHKLESDIRTAHVPPPTMSIPLRADCNYDSIPRLHKYVSELTLAAGVSMPKIVTAIASDGSRFKQLFKSGNDDLRQDAIMEQVFEQVSALLKHHSETRQRDLSIRTYKVLPLTSTAGVIEFVTNTMPLNNYLIPAHTQHNPKDMKPSECRRAVADAQGNTIEDRVRVFRKICDRFHPVLRYFFTDRFLDPDEWFERRLMFSRSTAAISMLGYILGLGDRHGQNILLDEKTGEVVHIDLGIAFETGRVLPIPEVVPFRLTRDIVDGMGITGTEGVFRRCCEFMLEALRKEEYSIMTILDVLRYDPLYNWSVSPLRMKRLQDDQKGEELESTAAGKIRDKTGIGNVNEVGGNNPSTDRKDDEAERALTVVRKKLSKSLSVAATVNELIQQATDPRNLAVLFAGWAAYL